MLDVKPQRQAVIILHPNAFNLILAGRQRVKFHFHFEILIRHGLQQAQRLFQIPGIMIAPSGHRDPHLPLARPGAGRLKSPSAHRIKRLP